MSFRLADTPTHRTLALTQELLMHDRNMLAVDRRVLTLFFLAVAGLWLPSTAQATLSEPPAIFYGDVIVDNQQLLFTDTHYSIVAKYNGVPLTNFQMGDGPVGFSNQYILRLPMDSVGSRTAGHARTGDNVDFFAVSTLGEEWLASTTLGERGSVTELNLGMLDIDGDNIDDSMDNCPQQANATQLDTDGDGAGDACDAFPTNSAETLDSDHDGMGDNFEIANGFDRLSASDAGQDADGDGISNLLEFQAGSNPRDPVPVADSHDVPVPLWALILLAAALGRMGTRRRRT